MTEFNSSPVMTQTLCARGLAPIVRERGIARPLPGRLDRDHDLAADGAKATGDRVRCIGVGGSRTVNSNGLQSSVARDRSVLDRKVRVDVRTSIEVCDLQHHPRPIARRHPYWQQQPFPPGQEVGTELGRAIYGSESRRARIIDPRGTNEAGRTQRNGGKPGHSITHAELPEQAI